MRATAAERDGAAGRRLPPIVVFGLVVLLGWCAWRVLSLGLADHYAAKDPEAALAWRGEHPAALLAAADAESPPERVAALARRALRGNPLQGRGYRLLAALESESDRAVRLYAIAAERSPRDILSLAWLFDDAVRAADYPAAVRQADQLLRVQPALLQQLHPVLAGLAAQPDGRTELAASLAQFPPWRTPLLKTLARQAPDPVAIAGLFERVRLQPRGLRADERHAWLERLIGERRWDAAYLSWVNLLPAGQRDTIGNVYNGGFEWAPSNSGFDWRIGRVAGARIDRAAVDGVTGERALRVAFEHRRVPFRHVRQLMALPPGSYRLEGRARFDGLDSERGLVWTLVCAEGGAALADVRPLAAGRAWHAFGVDFTVPASGCGGQWLTLRVPARIPAEERIGGVAWFDDLRVVRGAPPHALAAGLDLTDAACAGGAPERDDCLTSNAAHTALSVANGAPTTKRTR